MVHLISGIFGALGAYIARHAIPGRRRRQPLCCLLATITCLTPSARADQAVVPVGDTQWAAVGRLNIGGLSTRRACTATLITPDWVLTAAHCVTGVLPPARYHLREMQFVAGWNRGEYVAHSGIAEVIPHPSYIGSAKGSEAGKVDVALARLAEPITTITPLPLTRNPVLPSVTGFIGYRNDRPHAATIYNNCATRDFLPGLAYIGCQPVNGNSGSALLDHTPIGPRIVGVVSMRTPTGGLAKVLDDWAWNTIHGE